MSRCKLPKKLSDNLEGAVNDCIAAKRAGLELDMSYWHLPSSDDYPCSVCMAGARMDQTLKADRNLEVGPEDFDYETCQRLYAIDFMRDGDFVNAYYYSYDKYPSEDILDKLFEIGCFVRKNYNKTSVTFYRASWATYRAAVRKLRAIGL